MYAHGLERKEGANYCICNPSPWVITASKTRMGLDFLSCCHKPANHTHKLSVSQTQIYLAGKRFREKINPPQTMQREHGGLCGVKARFLISCLRSSTRMQMLKQHGTGCICTHAISLLVFLSLLCSGTICVGLVYFYFTRKHSLTMDVI